MRLFNLIIKRINELHYSEIKTYNMRIFDLFLLNHHARSVMLIKNYAGACYFFEKLERLNKDVPLYLRGLSEVLPYYSRENGRIS